MSAITYNITDEMEALQQAEHLQQIVWGMTPADTLSATTMRWMTHIGGFFIGAWDDDTMVGFCIASVGKRDNKWVLWSDMAGVHPDYQGHGIGYELKQRQKVWTREQGYEEIRWTFDPMRSGNAAFNFHKLGATSHNYHHDFYGEMTDNINRGLRADRLEAVWDTAEVEISRPVIDVESPFAIEFQETNLQVNHPDTQQVKIEIPVNLTLLKQEHPLLASKWQQAIGRCFTHYFENNYTAFDFERNPERSWYILHKNF